MDSIAERIQSLGGVSIAMAHDVAEMTLIPRPPRDRDDVSVQIARLLHGHEIVLKEARAMARQAAEASDDGTNDLLVSEVIRTNERQVWFLAEHLVNTPLVADDVQPLATEGFQHSVDHALTTVSPTGAVSGQWGTVSWAGSRWRPVVDAVSPRGQLKF